jgi:two-component sensor histidine kinase
MSSDDPWSVIKWWSNAQSVRRGQCSCSPNADRSSDLEAFGKRFSERIAALGRVQSLVSHAEAGALGLRELVEAEVRAHAAEDDDRVTIEGPRVALNEKAAETLALALHELATNAVKYGALASQRGRLRVGWAVLNRSVIIEWKESDRKR